MSTEELSRRHKGDPQGFTLVDTRQDCEFAASHILGAVSFPMEPTWWSRWQKKGALAAVLGPNKNRFIIFIERACHESAVTQPPVWRFN